MSSLPYFSEIVMAIKFIFNSIKAGKWGETASKWSGEPLQLHEFVDEWKKIGFRWIGGCCRIPPEQITKIREELLK